MQRNPGTSGRPLTHRQTDRQTHTRQVLPSVIEGVKPPTPQCDVAQIRQADHWHTDRHTHRQTHTTSLTQCHRGSKTSHSTVQRSPGTSGWPLTHRQTDTHTLTQCHRGSKTSHSMVRRNPDTSGRPQQGIPVQHSLLWQRRRGSETVCQSGETGSTLEQHRHKGGQIHLGRKYLWQYRHLYIQLCWSVFDTVTKGTELV